jgi:hypothetical protein
VSPQEVWFHIGELGVMIFGVVAPVIWATLRIANVLKDFPPHRHVNNKIIYPIGYGPTEVETQHTSRFIAND